MDNAIYTNLKSLLKKYYQELSEDAKNKMLDERYIFPKEYGEKFYTYSKALVDVLYSFKNYEDTGNLNEYAIELHGVLIREAARYKAESDFKDARERLRYLSKRYHGLSDLITLLSDKDLLRLSSASFRADSLIIDDIELFYDNINEMRKKYGLETVGE